MQPVIPLDKILERMREERQPDCTHLSHRPVILAIMNGHRVESKKTSSPKEGLQSLISRFDISLTF
jgi:hypothetical protein